MFPLNLSVKIVKRAIVGSDPGPPFSAITVGRVSASYLVFNVDFEPSSK